MATPASPTQRRLAARWLDAPLSTETRRWAWWLLGATLLGGALRFATLDRQSFWSDEAVTVLLARMHLTEVVGTIRDTESTPPLYYLAARGWSELFGTGEVGLRSLSALFGTLTIPVAFVAARTLVSSAAGLASAALVATNPLLVWYSQEARSYALLVVLTGASFAVFALLLDHWTTPRLVAWTLLCSLSLATHYFALFVVLPMAVWLLIEHRARSSVAAVLAVAAAGAALLPLLLLQRAHGFAEWISDSPLRSRLGVLAKQFLVGPNAPHDAVAAGIAGIFVLGLVTVALISGGQGRRGAAIPVAVAGTALGLPLALALAGVDYVNTQNAIAASFPLFVAAGAGVVVLRRATALAVVGATCVLGAALSTAVAVDASYQRGDWRGASRAVRAEGGSKLLVVAPDFESWFARVPLTVYLPEARSADAGMIEGSPQFDAFVSRFDRRPRPAVDRIALLTVAKGAARTPPLARIPTGFRFAGELLEDGFVLRWYRAPRPTAVDVHALRGSADGAAAIGILSLAAP